MGVFGEVLVGELGFGYSVAARGDGGTDEFGGDDGGFGVVEVLLEVADPGLVGVAGDEDGV